MMEWWKLQMPGSKLQRSTKLQIPKAACETGSSTACAPPCAFHRVQNLLQRKFHDGGASVSRTIIDQDRFALFHNARGENDVRHETLALEIGFRRENLSAGAQDAARVFQIQQQRAAGVGADARVLFAPAVGVIDLQPSPLRSDRWRPGADSANV